MSVTSISPARALRHLTASIGLPALPLAAVALLSMPPPAGVAATITGGTTPSIRPAGAPSVTTLDKGEQWLSWARRGVSKPYPDSLKFLHDQGAWFTPFNVRGMPGRYDIRGLHSLPATQDQAPARQGK